MKPILCPMVLIAVFAVLPLHVAAKDVANTDETRMWEKFATHTYKNLNVSLNGELTPVFRTLGDFGELYEYFLKDQNPEKYEAYTKFLVEVLFNAGRGDVPEAMFANVVLELTPPAVVLASIAPHIGPGGKLEGSLDEKHSDLAKYIQRQPQQGHIGSANLIQYVRYLKSGKMGRFTNQVNHEVMINHMLRTDPQNAFVAMLWVDYDFRPYSRTPYGGKKDEIPKVQLLQMAYADISDYLYRMHYNMPKYPFPIPDGLERKVKSHLKLLIDHKRWWVRLYVAHLLKSERILRWPDILEKVGQDQNPSIQKIIESIRSESPQFLRKLNKGDLPNTRLKAAVRPKP